MYRVIFEKVKRLVPRLSETELIALRSGGVYIDRDIFSGSVNVARVLSLRPRALDTSDINFMKGVDAVLDEHAQTQPVYPSPRCADVVSALAQRGLLGMIIARTHGGSERCVTVQSRVASRLASANPALGVVAMVPNSLGPGELLQHYGTDAQRRAYLPRLARGEVVPCFGLTGPHNGSDATGRLDRGHVFVEGGVRRIRVTLNKRYITLAPIADLMCVAFELESDVQNECGVTVALLERGHPGIEMHTHHDPNGAGFPNGTICGTAVIDFSQIIGGEVNAGKCWRMLMECLAIGRGVSLPSSALGMAEAMTFGIAHYIQHRVQFKQTIGRMEGVQEKFADMMYHTWVMRASVAHTNAILDAGMIPSVLTAAMKLHTTERARTVLMHGMDLYAGGAICTGENNFFTKFYNISPIGITVEGSNTLTRSLIVFGQGLNKSHPHVHALFDTLERDDHAAFAERLRVAVRDAGALFVRSVCARRSREHVQRLATATAKFACLANFVALLGARIKREQMMSGVMADILTNLYCAYSVLWYGHHFGGGRYDGVHSYVLDRLCLDTEHKINTVIDNYPQPTLRRVLRLTAYRGLLSAVPFDSTRAFVQDVLLQQPEILQDLRENVYVKDTVLEKLERLTRVADRTSDEYQRMYKDIVRVGEYENSLQVCNVRKTM